VAKHPLRRFARGRALDRLEKRIAAILDTWTKTVGRPAPTLWLDV
jgi:hypothetical protein